ncbi:hypothetical protein AALA69_03220 [Eggerthellaceae bacterium 24-137]
MGQYIHPHDGLNMARDKVKGLREIVNGLIESPNPCDMALHTLYYIVGQIEDDLDASYEMLKGTVPVRQPKDRAA